ncbi:MAG: hypothetical protein ACRD6W_07750 [Nitrososphaerales archaeon]
MDVFQHRRYLDLVRRDVNDDVVLPYADPRDARQVGQLVAVRVPDLRDVDEVLVCLTEISVVYHSIRPSEPGAIAAY